MLKRYMQVECFVSAIIRYCRGLDIPTKILSVMRWHKERCFESSFSTGDCSQAVDQVHGDNSLVVPHCREWLSFWKRFAFDGFQGFASAISCSLYQRGWKIGDALTGKLVGCIVVINLVPRLVLGTPFSGDRECFGVSPHRIEKSPTIMVSQPKLECYRPKHIIYVGD